MSVRSGRARQSADEYARHKEEAGRTSPSHQAHSTLLRYHYLYRQHLHASNYDDYYVSLELSIILCIMLSLLAVFVALEQVKFHHFDIVDSNERVDFSFLAMRLLIWTIGGCLINATLVFLPYVAIQKLNEKEKFGRLQASKHHIELFELLAHYKGFYAFLDQLLQEFSVENLIFLIEVWQYKYSPNIGSPPPCNAVSESNNATENNVNFCAEPKGKDVDTDEEKECNEDDTKPLRTPDIDDRDARRNETNEDEAITDCDLGAFSSLKLEAKKSLSTDTKMKMQQQLALSKMVNKSNSAPRMKIPPVMEMIAELDEHDNENRTGHIKLAMETDDDHDDESDEDEYHEDEGLGPLSFHTVQLHYNYHQRQISNLSDRTPDIPKFEERATSDTSQITDTETECSANALYVHEDTLVELNQYDDDLNEDHDDDAEHKNESKDTLNPNGKHTGFLGEELRLNVQSLHTYSVSASRSGVHSYEMESRQVEMNRALQILSDLPWFRLPLSDSYRKYEDRYFKAVHIFNKYLSSSAFDSLNISETSLTDIETTFRSLYEYKLRSYNIGLDLDERERAFNLDTQGRLSTSTYSRHINFDFFEEPEEVFSSPCNARKLPKVQTNTVSNTSSTTSSSTNASSAATIISMPSSLGTATNSVSSNNSPYPPNDGQNAQGISLELLRSKMFEHAPADGEEQTDHEKKVMKEKLRLKRKKKLRETLGLQLHFNTHDMFVDVPKIGSDEEFVDKLLSVFDTCLPDVLHNLESAFTRFRSSKQYYWILADKLKNARS